MYGDSLSAAYGIDEELGWASLLQKRLAQYQPDVTVINASISGETSRGGLARFAPTLEFSQADFVLLELGANDGLRGYPIESMRDNLRQMIELSQQSGAQVLMMGIRLPPNLGLAYNEPFEQSFALLADEYQLPLLPFLLDGVAGDDALMQRDGLHPKAIAQPIVLENVWAKLQPLLNLDEVNLEAVNFEQANLEKVNAPE